MIKRVVQHTIICTDTECLNRHKCKYSTWLEKQEVEFSPAWQDKHRGKTIEGYCLEYERKL